MISYVKTRLGGTEVDVPKEYDMWARKLYDLLDNLPACGTADISPFFSRNSYMRRSSIVDAAKEYIRGRGAPGSDIRRDKLYLNIAIEGNEALCDSENGKEWVKAVEIGRRLTVKLESIKRKEKTGNAGMPDYAS